MIVHGADAVDDAAASGQRHLVVQLTDLVTPLARERARDLGVEIVVADAAASAAPRVTGSAPMRGAAPGSPPAAISPPSPALFRRGAPLTDGVRVGPAPRYASAQSSSGDGTSGHRVGRVTIVGAGHVGMIAAMRLAESDLIDEVALVDVAGQRAAGIALDITHASPLLGFRGRITGYSSVTEAGPAEYVIITAGKARTPGMSRTDLVDTNAAIVGDLAVETARVSPDAVIVVVTNPLDEMTQHAFAVSGLPSSRVVGMAGVLDSSRFAALAAEAAGVSPTDVSVLALGSHGDEMVMPVSQATIQGRPITEFVSADRLDALVDRARNSGAEVVGLLGNGSAFFSPGLSAARMVLAMIEQTGELMAATVQASRQYGIATGYVGLPVRLGRSGLAEIVELPLTPAEVDDLRGAADTIATRVSALAAT